jgi:hypothetical protein
MGSSHHHSSPYNDSANQHPWPPFALSTDLRIIANALTEPIWDECIALWVLKNSIRISRFS